MSLLNYISSTARVPMTVREPVYFRVPAGVKEPVDVRVPVNCSEHCYQNYELKVIMAVALIILVCLCFCCCCFGICMFKFRHLCSPLHRRNANRSWLSRLNELEANRLQQRETRTQQKANRTQQQENKTQQQANPARDENIRSNNQYDKSILLIIVFIETKNNKFLNFRTGQRVN